MPDFLQNLFRNGGAPARTGAVPGIEQMLQQAQASGAPNQSALANAAPGTVPLPRVGAGGGPPMQTGPGAGPQDPEAIIQQLMALTEGGGGGIPPEGAGTGPPPGAVMPPGPPPPTILTEPPGPPPMIPADPFVGFKRAGESMDAAFRRRTGRWMRPEDFADEAWTMDQFQRTGEVPTKVAFMQRNMMPGIPAAAPDFTVGQ